MKALLVLLAFAPVGAACAQSAPCVLPGYGTSGCVETGGNPYDLVCEAVAEPWQDPSYTVSFDDGTCSASGPGYAYEIAAYDDPPADVAPAPEVDPSGAAGALTLLAGALAAWRRPR